MQEYRDVLELSLCAIVERDIPGGNRHKGESLAYGFVMSLLHTYLPTHWMETEVEKEGKCRLE